MKKILTAQEEQNISSVVQNFERKINAEFVIVINQASDPYPAARLRFSIMASILCSSLLTGHTEFIPAAVLILFIFFYLLSRISFFKRMGLNSTEVIREVKEKALETYYTQVLDNLENTRYPAILFYISLFERKIEIIVSKKILKHLNQKDLDVAINNLSQHFKRNEFNNGLLKSIELLEQKLMAAFPEKISAEYQDTLDNEIIWLDSSK